LSLFLSLVLTALTILTELSRYQMEQYPCLGKSFGWPAGFYHSVVSYESLAMPDAKIYFNTLGFFINVFFWFMLVYITLVVC